MKKQEKNQKKFLTKFTVGGIMLKKDKGIDEECAKICPEERWRLVQDHRNSFCVCSF